MGGPTTSAAVPQSEFARRAAKIGMGIHSTSQKLQKLAALAKRTSMFDDPAAEISELSTVVKQDIQALNTAIADLQTLAAGGSNKQSADHSHTVIDSLRTRLKDATKEFKDVLQARTDNLKAHQDRKALFSATPDQGLQPLFGQPGARGGRGGGQGRAQGQCAWRLARSGAGEGRRAGLNELRACKAHLIVMACSAPAGASFLPPGSQQRNPFGVKVRQAGRWRAGELEVPACCC